MGHGSDWGFWEQSVELRLKVECSAVAEPNRVIGAMTSFAVAEMWCACGERWVVVAPLLAFRYRCPNCGAWGMAPCWGGLDDLEVEVGGARLN